MGLAASQSRGGLTEMLGINLWLFTKAVLEGVLHQVTGLDTFLAPSHPKVLWFSFNRSTEETFSHKCIERSYWEFL